MIDARHKLHYLKAVRVFRAVMLAFVLLSVPRLSAAEQDILRELRNLREDMNKRFEQVDKRFEQIDKRFEQIDKRFEQIDKRFEQFEKRFEFIQAILVALIALAGGAPIVLEYFARKRAAQEQKVAEDLNKVIHALREAAEKDPKLDRALRHAGLL